MLERIVIFKLNRSIPTWENDERNKSDQRNSNQNPTYKNIFYRMLCMFKLYKLSFIKMIIYLKLKITSEILPKVLYQILRSRFEYARQPKTKQTMQEINESVNKILVKFT